MDTSIPEVSEEAATMRERVAIHLEDPACAVCHEITDPLGLGLENFDGIGRWRTSENGVAIDASGDLDDHEFTDPWGLSEAVAQHDQLGPCLTETMLGYAGGFSINDELDDLADWHTWIGKCRLPRAMADARYRHESRIQHRWKWDNDPKNRISRRHLLRGIMGGQQ